MATFRRRGTIVEAVPVADDSGDMMVTADGGEPVRMKKAAFEGAYVPDQAVTREPEKKSSRFK